MDDSRKWYALYTKPRHEFKAEEQLNSIDVENYLPTITLIKKWSDRKKKVVEPLFRGYIFIKATEKERMISLEQKAVIKTIFFNGKPSVIPEYEIESVRKMLKITSEVQVFNAITPGTRVRVVDGPFMGIEGVVYETNRKEDMLAINIELLNRSVVVRLPADSVTKNITVEK